MVLLDSRGDRAGAGPLQLGGGPVRWAALVDGLTAFGALAVTAMFVCYALEPRSSWFVLAFAGACLASAAYGFLQGAWPFGVVELAWAGVALRRWWGRRTTAVHDR
jgi:hypothetical protein